MIDFRGATGAARESKPGKTPIMAARRRLLFFKIEVRPRSCRSYHIWRPWIYSNISFTNFIDNTLKTGFFSCFLSTAIFWTGNNVPLRRGIFRFLWKRIKWKLIKILNLFMIDLFKHIFQQFHWQYFWKLVSFPFYQQPRPPFRHRYRDHRPDVVPVSGLFWLPFGLVFSRQMQLKKLQKIRNRQPI